MRNTIGKLCLSLTLALQLPARAPAATPEKIDPLVLGVKVYNMTQGAGRLFLALKVGANANDEDYLDKMAEKYKSERLPKATVKDGAVWLAGLAHPIRVVDLGKAQFSYNGKVFDVLMKEGVEKGLEDLQKLVYPRTDALWNWILPSAYASVDPMLMIAGIAGVAGFTTAANSCGDGPNNSAVGCGLGGLGVGFFLGYAITSLMKRDDPPTGIACYPGQMGCSQTVLLGANRVPINTISQCPGQGYNYSPALSQVPPAQGQYMAQQLSSYCPYPGAMSNINAAYGARLIPLAPPPAAPRPVTAAPNILPFSAARPQTASTLKPAAVRPAIAPALNQTPASPAGAAAK